MSRLHNTPPWLQAETPPSPEPRILTQLLACSFTLNSTQPNRLPDSEYAPLTLWLQITCQERCGPTLQDTKRFHAGKGRNKRQKQKRDEQQKHTHPLHDGLKHEAVAFIIHSLLQRYIHTIVLAIPHTNVINTACTSNLSSAQLNML